MNYPLTEDKIMWLDDETDMVFYRKAENSDDYEREVVDLGDVRRALMGVRDVIKSYEKLGFMTQPQIDMVLARVDYFFPIFAEKEGEVQK